MIPANFPEAHQLLGRPAGTDDQDCGPLPIVRAVVALPSGAEAPCVVSCWQPTPEEIEALADGGRIYLHVLGHTMPPVIVSTRIEARTVSSAN